uniref:PARP-type domain-containing protein n=1 Tax=Caenorhabditis japonica TaxID=281687 RepID=A0A8R1I0S1_CAEJA
MTTAAPTRFCTDYAKRVAKCQKCKMQLEKGGLRLGKIVPNFFVAAKDTSKPPPDMKQYFHKNCLFEMLFKARPTTKVIEETEEIEGFEDLNAEDQDDIKKLVEELMEKRSKDGPAEAKTPKKTPAAKKKKNDDDEEEKGEKEKVASRKRKSDDDDASKKKESKRPTSFNEESTFNSFHKFIQVCGVLKDLKEKSEKSEAIATLLKKKNFDGDVHLWLTFLIREADKREYHITDEQLISHFAKDKSLRKSKYYNDGFVEKKSAQPKEPKAKKSKKEKDSDDDEESDVSISESEDNMSDSEGDDDDDNDEISGSDSEEDVSEISSDEDGDDGESFKENSPKKVARGTRTRPRGNDGAIVKKEECPPDMEPCRYGESCYRKNKEHKEQFWHPSTHLIFCFFLFFDCPILIFYFYLILKLFI